MAPQLDTGMMEDLSRAYVWAVAARAGCIYQDTRRDLGTDAELHYVEWVDGKPRETGLELRLQIKATTQGHKHTPAEVILDLEVEHYRKLIVQSPGVRSILIVFDMPEEDARWLDTAQDGLVMRNCAYWVSLEGWEDVSNETRKRVKIPRTQRFDVDAVRGALRRIACREDAISAQRRERQRERSKRSLPTVGRRPSP